MPALTCSRLGQFSTRCAQACSHPGRHFGVDVQCHFGTCSRWAGFVKSIIMTMYRDLTGQGDKINRHNQVAAKIAEMTSEDKADSLSGVEWIFVGFLLQTVGAIL